MPLDRRRLLIVVALLAVSGPLALAALGPPGLLADAALWTLLLAAGLAPRWPALRRELAGALAIFATAAFFDNLDDFLGGHQEVTLSIVGLTCIYLALRHRDAGEVVLTPAFYLLALFYAQQLASAWFFRSDDLPHLFENRVSIVATTLAGAVLARQPDGRRLLLWLIALGALLSVPIMAFELWRPDVLLFSFSHTAGPLRAGGMYGQANEVGTALGFAMAALLALRTTGQIGRRTLLALLGACGFGILACASRGALVVALAVVAARAWVAAAHRAGRAPIATTLLAAGVLVFGLPPLADVVARNAGRLAELGFDGADRLAEVVRALGGSTEELADDDSNRIAIARQGLALSSERPLFGFGTGRFKVEVHGEIRAHVQLLEIFGENGAVGLLLYLVAVAALVRAAWRAEPALRTGALLLLGAWLLTQLDNHDLLDYRSFLLPVGYVCGLPPPRRADTIDPTAAGALGS